MFWLIIILSKGLLWRCAGNEIKAVYADPDYINSLVLRSPDISEIELATIIADKTVRSIKANKVIRLVI